MLKKSLSIVTALVFCMALVAAGTAMANNGPAELVLKTAKAKKPAAFPHKKHQDMYKCGQCHHGKDATGKQTPYVDGQEIKKCVTCHNKKDMTNKKLNSFKAVGHARCKECHKKVKKEGEKAPTKCTGCHVKGLK